MKGPSLAILFMALMIASIASFAGSTSQQMLSVPLSDAPGLEARRSALIEFAAQHDWLGDFQRAGIELPVPTTDQLLEPLLGRKFEGEGSRITMMFALEMKGLHAFQPNFRRIDAAVDWIEARLTLEAIFLELRGGTEPDRARGQLWRAYGLGFEPEFTEFLAKWKPDGLLAADLALVEALRARLAESPDEGRTDSTPSEPK